MRKKGCRPRIYIGSGTGAIRGMWNRMRQYETLRRADIPDKVWEAHKEGFIITHKGWLVSCPIPDAAIQPEVRLALIALEAVFCFTFQAIYSLKSDFGYGNINPWKKSDVEWDGCCTHSPLVEGVHGKFDLTQGQRLAMAKSIEEKNKAYQVEYGKQMRAKARAGKNDEYKHRQRAANAKRAPKQKEIYKVVKASGKFKCKICNVNCRNMADLRRHNKTDRHQRYARDGKAGYHCVACNFDTPYPSNWKRHLETASHKTKTRN